MNSDGTESLTITAILISGMGRMILENLSRAIRDQNYYAVFLEFVIVIAGVVIGFQVNAWNQERQEAQREHAYLERLATEIQVVTETLMDQRANTDSHRARAVRFLSALQNDDRAAAEGDSFGPLAVTRAGTPTVVPAMLNELLASGQLSTITRQDLRAELSRLALFDTTLRSLSDQLNSQQSLIVHEINRYLRVRIDKTDFEGVSIDFERMLADPAFENRLAYSIYLNFVLSEYLETAVERTRVVEHLLSEALAERGGIEAES